MGDVLAQGVAGFHRRIREHAEQVHVLQVAKRPRQLVLDEPEHPFERLDADLDEEPGRLRDVLPRGLEEPRNLPQLRADAPCPLRQIGVSEQGLAGKAGRQRVGVVQRAAFPVANLLECEQVGADAIAEHPSLQRLDGCQRRRIDAVEAARPSAELPDTAVDCRAAQVFQQVVVRVDAVGRGCRGIHLVEVGEMFLDEVRERLRDVGGRRLAHRSCHTQRSSGAFTP